METGQSGAGWRVRGHEWAERLLKGHITQGKVRHAYLFVGPKGVGRRTLALSFAKALNCLQPPQPGEFCGACRVCRQIDAMQHSDLTVTRAEEEGGTLKVEQVRDLQRSLSLMPYEGHYRVAMLLHFEDANPSAQNALLKTLEEAPQHVILLLTAESAESLLPTIASRCETLRLRPLGIDDLGAELKTRGMEAAHAKLLAHLAGGRLGMALRMQNSPDLLAQRSAAMEDLLFVLGMTRRERFAYAEKIVRDRQELRERFAAWLSFWRDVMLRVANPSLAVVNLDFADKVDALAGRLDLETARARVNDLERGIARLDANVNARLLTEVILLDWPKITLVNHYDEDEEFTEEE